MLLHLIVKPNSRTNQLDEDGYGNMIVRVKAPPVDGKANKELIRFLAEILRLPKSSIEILAGENSKYKKVNIAADEKHITAMLLKYKSG